MAEPDKANSASAAPGTDKAAKPDAGKPANAASAPKAAGKPSGVQLQPRVIGATRRRRRMMWLSFLMFCILPSALGIVYYTKYASDRYASGASFVVRGLKEGVSGDMLSSITGFSAGGSTSSDSYVIQGFMVSPDLLRTLDTDLSVRAHYSNPDIDPLSRYNNTRPFEDFVRYWRSRVTTTYDNTTGIVHFEVQAFDPQMALNLANAVLDAVDKLVNNLSEAARRDAVYFATSEVERAEEKLRDAQSALREFRSVSGTVDPSVNAKLDAELIATLETQLSETVARIRVLSAQVDAEAPSLRQLQAKAEALQKQISERRAVVGNENPGLEGDSTADALARYEALQLEQTFSQQRYASALASLESARVEADRQQRYLAVFSEPSLPEDAVYPERVRDILIIIFGSFVIWAIGALISTAVRDHMR